MQRHLLRTVGPRMDGRFFLVLLLLLLTGCAGVSMPVARLDEAALASESHTHRSAVAVHEALDLATARALLRTHSPALALARADEVAARSRAAVPTPWPNPTLEVTPLLFSGVDVLTSSTLGSAWNIGWRVLVFNEPKLADSIDRARAASARATRIAIERREYLALRRALVEARLTERRVEAAMAVRDSAARSREFVERAAAAGGTTALDVELATMELARAEDAVQTASDEAARAKDDIAARLGLAPDRIQGLSADLLPQLPEDVPSGSDLRARIARGHPDLMVERMAWLENESELRLAMARQIPGIDMGIGYDSDDLDTLGFPIGIEIPIFDRNQKQILPLRAKRAAIRGRYQARLRAQWSAAEAALANVERERRHLAAMQGALAPAAERALDVAQRAAKAGHADALRVLEINRNHREVQLDLLERELALWRALLDLEAALGAPLLPIPDGAPSAPTDSEVK